MKTIETFMEMPYKEKYESTLGFMKMLDTFVPITHTEASG